MISKRLLKLLLVLLFCFLSVGYSGTGFAAEETYSLTIPQQQQLLADLAQLDKNNQQQEQISTEQAQQILTLKEQLTKSQKDLTTLKGQLTTSQADSATLKVQLTTSQQELQKAKTSLQAAQKSLQETEKSWKDYQKSISEKHFSMGAVGGVVDSKAVAFGSLGYTNKSYGVEVMGNKTDVLVELSYRF